MLLRKEPDQYDKHTIATAPGTHAAVLAALSETLPKDARILDLGSLSGAMVQRFRDGGYTNLHAADLTNHLTVEVKSFVQVDCNKQFSESFTERDFDAVIACEVIEHLDDPRHFLREIGKLLKPNGRVCITTPNVAFFEGRIKFLLYGELFGYGAKNYTVQRHISPLTREQVPLLFRECGFEMLSYGTAGSFATRVRRLVTAPIWIPMRALLGEFVLGEVILSVARKAGPDDLKTSSEALWGVRRT